MNFADSLNVAYQTKWSFINSFSVNLNFPLALLEAASWEDYDNEKIQLNIISIDTPQFTNSPIEAFVADKWVIHNGRDEVYRFNITFRDQNQMELYNKFLKMYRATRLEYFDDAKLSISIFKDADWINEVDSKAVVNLTDVLIENISQIQFNNTTENQIAEFTVGFKCTNYKVY